MKRIKKIDVHFYLGKQFLVIQGFCAFIPRERIWKFITSLTLFKSTLHSPIMQSKMSISNWHAEQFNLNAFLAFELYCHLLWWCRKWHRGLFPGAWVLLIMKWLFRVIDCIEPVLKARYQVRSIYVVCLWYVWPSNTQGPRQRPFFLGSKWGTN